MHITESLGYTPEINTHYRATIGQQKRLNVLELYILYIYMQILLFKMEELEI